MRLSGETLKRIDQPLQAVAKAACWASCAVGLVALAVCVVSNARMQVRCEFARQEQQRLVADGETLEARLRSKSGRVQEAANEVARELDEKRKLHLAMSEVLSRARVLQEQRDRFEILRGQIAAHLSRMDQYYDRARQQAPTVSPP
jgi:hypothetical protein